MREILKDKLCEICGAKAATYSKYGYLCALDFTEKYRGGTIARIIDKVIDELMALSDEDWNKELDEAGYDVLSQNTMKIFSE